MSTYVLPPTDAIFSTDMGWRVDPSDPTGWLDKCWRRWTWANDDPLRRPCLGQRCFDDLGGLGGCRFSSRKRTAERAVSVFIDVDRWGIVSRISFVLEVPSVSVSTRAECGCRVRQVSGKEWMRQKLVDRAVDWALFRRSSQLSASGRLLLPGRLPRHLHRLYTSTLINHIAQGSLLLEDSLGFQSLTGGTDWRSGGLLLATLCLMRRRKRRNVEWMTLIGRHFNVNLAAAGWAAAHQCRLRRRIVIRCWSSHVSQRLQVVIHRHRRSH